MNNTNITKEKEIEILMADKCTEYEAKKYLSNGTVIYADFEENFESYAKEWLATTSEDFIEELRKMVETHKAIEGWSIVDYEENLYYIEYVM